jgi:hypothetical protein
LNGNNGGAGFGSNPWSAVAGLTDPALASGSLTYTSGSRSIDTEGNRVAPALNSRSTRNLDAPEVVANRTLWIGFRMNFTGSGAFPTNHAGFSLFSTSNGGGSELFMGKPGSATNWGVDTSTQSAVQAPGSVSAADKNAFLLTRITYGATTANVDMWVNPPLDDSQLGAPQVSSTDAAFNIVSMRVSTGANASGFEFDEFRMADTFNEVVPEPAGLGLAGAIAAAGLLRRRRAPSL